MHTNEQNTLVINKLLAICDNEILTVDIPGDSSFEDLPFECQLQYMCFVKCAGLFSSIGESEQAVNSYLRVRYAAHVFLQAAELYEGDISLWKGLFEVATSHKVYESVAAVTAIDLRIRRRV